MSTVDQHEDDEQHVELMPFPSGRHLFIGDLHGPQGHSASNAVVHEHVRPYVTLSDLTTAGLERYMHSKMPGRPTLIFGRGDVPGVDDAPEFIQKCIVGAIAPIKSVQVIPRLDAEVVETVLSTCVPEAVVPKEGDTPKTLAARLLASNFYDDLLALVGGGSKGSKRVRLNATTNSTPRRRAYSIVVADVHRDKNGALVRTMYAYGKPNSRIRTQVMATPMPWPIFELGLQCFLSVRYYLCDICAARPPNHCQLMGYYALFDSKCGRHKDDHSLRTLHRKLWNVYTLEEAVRTCKGAMVAGSDVLIYSNGPLPAVFSWCHTTVDRPFMPRKYHEIHPCMQIELSHGSLFVFKAVDDLHFYHEVFIDWTTAQLTDHRFAFVFRWLGEEQQYDFPCADMQADHTSPAAVSIGGVLGKRKLAKH